MKVVFKEYLFFYFVSRYQKLYSMIMNPVKKKCLLMIAREKLVASFDLSVESLKLSDLTS